MRLSRTQRRTAAIVASAGVIAALSAPGSAANPTSSVSPPTLVDKPGSTASPAAADSRVGTFVRPTQAQVAAVRDLVTARPGTKVGWDLRFGTPRTITPTIGSRLSGPSSGSAVTIAKSWLTTNRAMLGLSAADISALLVRRDHVLPENGTHVISFTQTFSGVPAARGGSLGVAVDSSGRVLNYTGETIRSSGLLGAFTLTTTAALKKVATSLAPTVAFSPVKSGSVAGYDSFKAVPSRVAPTSRRRRFRQRMVPGRRTPCSSSKKLDQAYEVVIDAATGAQLYKHSLVTHEDDTSGGTIYAELPRRCRWW